MPPTVINVPAPSNTPKGSPKINIAKRIVEIGAIMPTADVACGPTFDIARLTMKDGKSVEKNASAMPNIQIRGGRVSTSDISPIMTFSAMKCANIITPAPSIAQQVKTGLVNREIMGFAKS